MYHLVQHFTEKLRINLKLSLYTGYHTAQQTRGIIVVMITSQNPYRCSGCGKTYVVPSLAKACELKH